MSPENCGVFQLLKKETQPAIAREDWNTDGSPVMHQTNHHLCPACCHWIKKQCKMVQDVTAYYQNDRLDVTRSYQPLTSAASLDFGEYPAIEVLLFVVIEMRDREGKGRMTKERWRELKKKIRRVSLPLFCVLEIRDHRQQRIFLPFSEPALRLGYRKSLKTRAD